jgi:AraC family transcriptional regulator
LGFERGFERRLTGCGYHLGHTMGILSTLLATRATGRHAPAPQAPGLTSRERERVDDYLRANIERNVTLAELAAAVNLSPSHFARQFKLSTGLAPHQFLIHLRVSLARDMMLKGGQSLAMVAQQAGFADHSHMTRHFREVLGATPSDVLKSARTFQG